MCLTKNKLPSQHTNTLNSNLVNSHLDYNENDQGNNDTSLPINMAPGIN